MCAAGRGRGRGSPALFGFHPRTGRWGCSWVNPQAVRGFPIVGPGDDGGEGRGFIWVGPSSPARRAEHPGVSRPQTLSPPSPPRPKASCPAHSRGKASLHQTKYGFFPVPEKRRVREDPLSSGRSTSQALRVWDDRSWGLGRTMLGTAHLSQITLLFSCPVSSPVKWEGAGEDSAKESPERATWPLGSQREEQGLGVPGFSLAGEHTPSSPLVDLSWRMESGRTDSSPLQSGIRPCPS